MNKVLLVTAALVMVASPTFAQSYAPGAGLGYLGDVANAGHRNNVTYGHHARPNRHHAVSQPTPYDAYAQSPGAANGYRWPGALYDAQGHFIDQNSPGRW